MRPVRRHTPLTLPSSQYLESWHTCLRTHTLAFATTNMVRVGTSPAISCTGSIASLTDVWLKCTLGGPRGTATVQASVDGGATYSGVDLLSSASPVAIGLGTSLSANFNSGTYVLNDTWRLPWGTWTDGSLKGHTFSQVANNQVPTIDMDGINGRPALNFEKTRSHILECNTAAYATALLGGSDTPCTIFQVAQLTGVTSAQHVLWGLANQGVSTGVLAFMALTSAWLIDKRGDTGPEILQSGGATDSDPHIFEVVQRGTTVDVLVDGSLVVSGAAQDAPNTSVTKAQIGGVMSGANAYSDALIGEHQAYRTALSDSDRSYIRQNLMNRWGF